jgi:hypothetical protein
LQLQTPPFIEHHPDKAIAIPHHLIELSGGITEGFDRQVGQVTDKRAPFVEPPGNIADHDQVDITPFMQLTLDIGTKDDNPGDWIPLADSIREYLESLL